MPVIQKFTFDHSFDDGRDLPRAEPVAEAEPEPPPPPPEPTFTLSELREQIAQADAAGHAQGLAEGRRLGAEETVLEAERALAASLAAVEGSLSRLLAVQADEMVLRRQNTARIALAAVRKLFPVAARRHGLAEVEALVATILGDLADEPKLVVRVHEGCLEPLQDRIGQMAVRQGFAGAVTVVADPRLGPMDVKADWGAGGAERDTAALWAEIERIAGDVLAGFPDGPEAAAPAPAQA